MKKNYITPKSLVVDIDFAEIMLTLSNGEADPEKDVLSKERNIVDFSDEDMF